MMFPRLFLNWYLRISLTGVLAHCLLVCSMQSATVSTIGELQEAAETSQPGDVIELAAGVYELNASLELKEGVTLQGAGIDQTILRSAATWNPSSDSLPDREVKLDGLDQDAYLIKLANKAPDITISNLTLRGPRVHGAIFGFGNERLHLHHLKIEDVVWSGIRLFSARNARIHDCEFVDAGGKWKKGGIPGTDGGISGGAMFLTWAADTEISHNRIRRTFEGRERAHFGIKGRGGRRIHIHHNTIEVNFSIEFPFEGADSFEIDHNILQGVVSIPKHAGGKVPESGVTYHIHHNYFTTSYAIEFVRNGVEISHNLFDFDREKDGGNLISGFGKAGAAGPALFHNNLINNPGRGVIWINPTYDNLTVRNNHIIARPTVTPRKEGLFGLNTGSDYSTISITDNIIECEGLSRPLLRRDESYAAEIRNNQLINVSDVAKYGNPISDRKPGLEEPLKFRCGVHGELEVDGWETRDVVP